MNTLILVKQFFELAHGVFRAGDSVTLRASVFIDLVVITTLWTERGRGEGEKEGKREVEVELVQ